MKVSFVIPFHNEQKNIQLMITQVAEYAKKQKHKWDFEIIPVNDRSCDNTKQILNDLAKKYSFIKPVHRTYDAEELGNTMGKALLIGSKKATGEIVIWTMGDRADDCQTYSKMVEKIQQGYDLVFGSRYIPGGTWGNLDPTKAFLSSRGTILAKLIFGIPVHDITNAFRAFKADILKKIKLESNGFAISPEFAIKAHLLGFKLGEVPTVYYDRVEGVSNFKLWKMSSEYLILYLKLFIQRLLGTKYLHNV